jgi:tetratricopeptide (TPR) repeat protein
MSSPPVSPHAAAASFAHAVVPSESVQPSASTTSQPAHVPVSALPASSDAASPSPSPPDDFPMDGLPLSFFRELINANGGEAAFEGLTTSNVKRSIIVPKTQSTKLSLCAHLRLEGDARVEAATWFVSHAWQCKFMDVVRALEAFFADKPGAIMWMDLFSTSQHATFDKPPEWWQQTFVSAIGRMGQMVMVMTPWDSPVSLKRAWCLVELYACRSSGSRFGVALPPSERSRFLDEIADRGAAFYGMLSKVNTAKSECSRDSDRERIFAAVRGLNGGFMGLDRSVLHTMTEWLERQLVEEMAYAVAGGRQDAECKMMSALGTLFMYQGKENRALPMHEECLTKRKRILGNDHPDTLTSLNDLAMLFENIFQYDRALSMYEDCLARRKRILGEEHPCTLASLNNLASLLESMGQRKRALPMHEECLARSKRILGEDHPSTLISLSNLAFLIKCMGQYDRALPMYEKCLSDNKRILGEDHPCTLASLNNLASLLENMGQYDRALPMYEKCLSESKRILGEDHPSTLVWLNNFALLFKRMGQYDRALPMYEECLARRKRILGEDHPEIITSLNNLASLFERMGQYDRALSMYEKCLSESKRILGEHHPDTKSYRSHHRRCADGHLGSIIVESSMLLINTSPLPPTLFNSAKQRVMDRLGLIVPKKIFSG